MLINHFGHSIVECISRLWYVVESGATERIAVLATPNTDIHRFAKVYNDIFDLLDVDLKRIILIERPAQFRRVIVPDETVHVSGKGACYKDKYTVVHEKMMSRVKPKDVKKIYMTRRQLKKQDVLGEEYFEDFFRKRGYTVLVPEQFGMKEMAEYMKGAEEVACIVGTSSLFLLLARPGTKFTGLVRIAPVLDDFQFFLITNQAKELDYRLIDVSFNLLPYNHGFPCFLLGPSKQWRAYLDVAGEKCGEEELSWDISKYAYDYLLKWIGIMHNASLLFGGNTLLFDNFDVLNTLSTALLDKPLKIEDFKPVSYKEREKALLADIERLKGDIANPDVKRLEDEVLRLEAENRRLEIGINIAANDLRKIKASMSWKIARRLIEIATPLLGKRKEKVRAFLNKGE